MADRVTHGWGFIGLGVAVMAVMTSVVLAVSHRPWPWWGTTGIIVGGALALVGVYLIVAPARAVKNGPMTPNGTPEGGNTFNVTSHGQQGGVTAGQYINQAPEPKVSAVVAAAAQPQSDGTYLTQYALTVENAYRVNRIGLLARGPSVTSVRIGSSGAFTNFAEGQNQGWHFIAFDRPSQSILFDVITSTAGDPIEIHAEIS